MATLTEASIMSRKGIRYTIYGIIFLIVARIFIISLVSIYKKVFPPPPEPATVAFGRLPKLTFPERAKHTVNFSLETPSGGLPSFPDKTNVYIMPKIPSNLLSLDFAKQKARRLGYDSEPQQITESLYKFYHKNAPASMETNIITGSFAVSYDFNIDSTPLSFHPSLPDVALKTVSQYLNGADLLPDDLTGPSKHRYLKTKGGRFVPALSLSDASLIRIDLFRKDINELPSVTQTASEGNVWFMVSGVRDRGKDIVSGEYHYFPIDETQVATYPLKTGNSAWQELLDGNYYPASFGSTVEGEEIKIRKIYLAYYDAGVYTEFYQPVFVFEGDKDFVGYVPAVTAEYYGD